LFFELIDGVLYASSYYNGTATRRNIDYFRPADNTFYRYDIQMTTFRANFFVNNILVASISTLGTDLPLYSDVSLPIFFGNVNTGVTTDTAELWLQSAAGYNSAHQTMVMVDPFNNDQVANVSKSGRLLTRNPPELRFEENFVETLDTTVKWTETILGGATAVKGPNYMTFATSTASGDSVIAQSKLTYLPKSLIEPMDFYAVANTNAQSDANNVRELGVKAGANDGFFFRIAGSSALAVVLRDGIETTVDLGIGGLNDDKYHEFLIKMRGTHYVWFFIDNDQYYFQAASANQLLLNDSNIAPYFANYNTGTIATPISLTVMSMSILDHACQTMNISGRDTSGVLREVKVDTEGRFYVAPFEPIQTTINYIGQKVNQIIETDVYGKILTTDVVYTGQKVTSITQVLT
jgi:hypothetical protein